MAVLLPYILRASSILLTYFYHIHREILISRSVTFKIFFVVILDMILLLEVIIFF